MIKENQNQSLFLTESKTYPSETRILSIWIGIRVPEICFHPQKKIVNLHN